MFFKETYGMDCKTTYRQQAERCLNQAMCNGSLSLFEYNTHRIDIQQSALSGVDDGHSATNGLLIQFEFQYVANYSELTYLVLFNSLSSQIE